MQVRSLLRACLCRSSLTSDKRKTRLRSASKLALASQVAIENLEVRTLFGGGAGATGPVTLGTGPCCLNGSGPLASAASTSSTTGEAGSPASPADTSSTVNTFSVSTAPVSYLTGTPVVYADDLISDGFGQPWGVTRNWTGQDDASQFGNGWMNTSQPYLIVNKQDSGGGSTPIIEEVVDGVTENCFEEAYVGPDELGNDSPAYAVETPLFQSADKLVYVLPQPEMVVGIEEETPAEYQLTDSSGDVTTFCGLARNADGILTNDGVYPQEPTEQSDGTYYRLGAFVSFQDSYGNVTTAVYDSTSASDNLEEVDRSDPVSGEQQRFVYTYATITNTEGGSASMVSQVALEQRPNSTSSWTTIQGANYYYYTGDGSDSAYGHLGDLKLVTMWNEGPDSIQVVTGQDYYRYYKFWGTVYNSDVDYAEQGPTDIPATAGGTDDTYPKNADEVELGGLEDYVLSSGLSVVVQGENFSRLLAAYGSISAIDSSSTTQADLTPYADNTFSYQRYQNDTIQATNWGTSYRVISETSEGGGCSCMGNDGVGVFDYTYVPNTEDAVQNPVQFGTAFDPNQWAMETIVNLPSTTPGDSTSSNEDIVYTNAIGEVMMFVAVDADIAEPTYYRYDDSGRLIMTAAASALAPYVPSTSGADPGDTTYEDNSDLVGYDSSTETYENIFPNTGLISTIIYGNTTTASTTPEDVLGYIKSQAVQQGYAGAPIVTESQQYIAQTNAGSGATIYPIATSTDYQNDDGTGAEMTTYNYTWSGDSYAMTGMTVSSPVISASQNGSDAADVTQTLYDSFGWPVWTTDPNGAISYTSYNVASGAVTKQIQDVNPSAITDPVAGPTRTLNNLARVV
jgi:hypothetical protein